MPLLDLRPKLSSLECLHVSWLFHSCVGGPYSKILVGPHCSFSYWWASATLIAICPGFGTFSSQIMSLLYQLNPWVVYWLCPLNTASFVSNAPRSLKVYQPRSHVLPNMIESPINWLSGSFPNGRKACVKLGKSPLLSCLWQLSYVLLRCVLIFGSPACWLLTL